MKHPTHLLAILASLVLATLPAFSQQAAPEPPPNIQFELQLVTLPEPLALELIPDLLDKNKIEAANTRLKKCWLKGRRSSPDGSFSPRKAGSARWSRRLKK